MLRNLKTTLKLNIKLGDDHIVCSSTAGLALLGKIELYAYYVPEFRVNLLSVSQLDVQGYKTTCEHGQCLIEKTGYLLLVAKMKNGLYQVSTSTRHNSPAKALITTRSMMLPAKHIPGPKPPEPTTAIETPMTISEPQPSHHPPKTATKMETIELWHKRLAHLNQKTLHRALNITDPGSDTNIDLSKCDICIKAKHQQYFERKRVPLSTKPFELIHSDSCGPIGTLSVGGAAYYILYIDDCTRHTELYFLITKSADEIRAKFVHYMAWVKAQGYTIKRFRCDNGRGEFNNKEFLELLGSKGITYEPAPPYSQHKNG